MAKRIDGGAAVNAYDAAPRGNAYRAEIVEASGSLEAEVSPDGTLRARRTSGGPGAIVLRISDLDE